MPSSQACHLAFQLGEDDTYDLADPFRPLTADDLNNLSPYEIAIRPCVNGSTIRPGDCWWIEVTAPPNPCPARSTSFTPTSTTTPSAASAPTTHPHVC